MQFWFMPEKGTVDAIFIVRRNVKRRTRSCICVLLTWKKAFDRVLRKVMEWTMRKKGLSEVTCMLVQNKSEGRICAFREI